MWISDDIARFYPAKQKHPDDQNTPSQAGGQILTRLFYFSEEHMALKEKISEDIKTAMKSGDKVRLETLRTLRAVLMEKEIDLRGSGKAVTPDDEIATLLSAAKKRKESIEQFQAGGRMDLVAQETSELAIIQEYLPKQMGEEEIKQVIESVVKETGASSAADFGKVMPQVMKQLKGKADGKMIQELVKTRLG